MADVEQFKDDVENNADGLIGESRGDFMEALGEAVYAQIQAAGAIALGTGGSRDCAVQTWRARKRHGSFGRSAEHNRVGTH